MININETEVIKAWQKGLSGSALFDTCGNPIKIIYPGRRNDARGPDYCDAVVVIGNRIFKGDIEVHVNTGDWQAHHHNNDVYYNNVVLQVAGQSAARHESRRQNGSLVPTLLINENVFSQTRNFRKTSPDSRTIKYRCRQKGPLGKILDQAGEARFNEKSGDFKLSANHEGMDQSLYRGIMGALGYSRNKISFLELASLVNISCLQNIMESNLTDDGCLVQIQALLLGTARLLPSQRRIHPEDDNYVNLLENIWLESARSEISTPWQLFRVTPVNHPVIRAITAAYLILKYRRLSMLETLMQLVEKTSPGELLEKLADSLSIEAGGYWREHHDFGLKSALLHRNLPGTSRVRIILINVILPFLASLSHDRNLAGKALNAYITCPRLDTNTVERHMTNQLGVSSKIVNTACRQQGLLHIYHRYCAEGKCADCPVIRQALN